MKTGIIVYSKTGHTLLAGQKLLETLRSRGKDAELLEVKAESDQAGSAQAKKMPEKMLLTVRPSPEAYQELVFASPVWGFSLSGVMKDYLSGLPSLKGKKVRLFVTHQLPLPWMGGNAAIRQMKKLCEDKGGEVVSSAVISWNEKRRERDLADMTGRLA